MIGIQSPRNTNIQKPKSMYMKITTIPTLISLKFEPKVMLVNHMHKTQASFIDQLLSKEFTIRTH